MRHCSVTGGWWLWVVGGAVGERLQFVAFARNSNAKHLQLTRSPSLQRANSSK